MDGGILKSKLDRAGLLSELRGKVQRAESTISRASANLDKRTVELAFASEAPYERFFGIEVLDMKPASVRMDRLKNSAALLLNHDRDMQIGVVESAKLGQDKVGRATVRFSRSTLGEEILNDVVDGIRTKVSVGYMVHDLVLEKQQDDLSTYRVTDWEPFEISIVSIPADDTVGVGRAATSDPGTVGARQMTEATVNAGAAGEMGSGADQLVENLGKNDAAARSDERKRTAKRNNDILELGDQWPEYGGPALSRQAILDPNMTVEGFRASMLKLLGERHKNPQVETGNLEFDRKQPGHQGNTTYGMGAREMLAAANLKMFKGIGAVMGKPDHEVAFRAGMWARAAIHGDQDALRWCKDAGVQLHNRAMNEGSFTSAGWLVPIEMEAAIIKNREQYGVARRICRVIDMSSASTSIPRITSDVTAYFVGEGTGGTQSDPAGDQVTLTLKDLMAYTTIGKSSAQDTVVSLAEMVAEEHARSFAIKEDACLISGDGTSTYGGIQGIKTLLDNSAYSAGRVQATSAHDTFPEIDVTDVTSLLAILPVYARAGARWLCSGVFEALVFGRLKANAGGQTTQTLTGGIIEQDFAGFTVTVAHHMPAGAGTTYNASTILIMGNFNLGVAIGSGSGLMMTVDPYTNAHLNQTRVITQERIDIVAHGVSSSTTAGPIVGLHGKT